MSLSTLFLSPRLAAWSEDVSDPSQAQDPRIFGRDVRHNILWYRAEDVTLDNEETRTLTPKDLAVTDWPFVMVTCIGAARVNTTGKDFDGSTDITGKLPVYGTAVFPGKLVLSTYNLSAIVLESLADDTRCSVFVGVAAEDDDSRLDTFE